MYCTADEEKEHILFDFPDEWGSLDIQQLIRRAADFETITEPIFAEIESPQDITDHDALSLVTHIKESTILYNLNPRHWSSNLELKINNFIRETKIKLLTIYYEERHLCVSYNFPKERFVDLQYFIKIIDGINLSVSNFNNVVISSTIHGSIEDSIFLIMSRIYAPILYKLSTNHKYFDDWLHHRLTDYMIELTQLRTTLSGYINLYVPPDIGNINAVRASKNLSIVKRFNSIVMSWYVAIKDFLQEFDEFVTDTDVSSPLEELEIWTYLYRNFCGIWSIFSSKTVGDVCKVLIEAQSSFVNLLFTLAKPTKDALSITRSNIKYFQVLIKPFNALNEVNAPSEITLHLPRILFAIRFIWMKSPHYNDELHLIKVCSALSNGIANFLMKFIDVSTMLQEKPSAGIKILQEVCQTCKDYKHLYRKAVALHNIHNDKHWPDIADQIFLIIDKLYDRCSDLIEVCNSVVIFGRIDNEADIQKPQFSWARCFELEKYVDRIESQYQANLENVKKYQELILDLKSDEWKGCYGRFKDGLLEIDCLVEDLMMSAFSTVDNVEEGLEILQSLIKCSKRVRLTVLFEKFTVHLYELLLQESADAKKDALLEKSYTYQLMPRYGGRALMAYNKKERLLVFLALLKNSTWLPFCVLENDVHKRCKLIIKYLDQILDRHYNKWLSLLPSDMERYYNRPLLKVSNNSDDMIALNINRNFINTLQEAQFWSWLKKSLPESVETALGFTDNFYHIFSSAQLMILHHNRMMAELTGSEKLLFNGYITKLKTHLSQELVTNCDWSGEKSLIFIKESLAIIESFQTVIKYYKYKTFGIFKLTLHAAFRSFVTFPEIFTYSLESFQFHLKDIRDKTKQRLQTCHLKIVEHLEYLEKLLEKNIENAKPYWGVFIYNIDLLFKDAMCSCVALSLEKLLQFLQGSMYSRTGFIKITIIEKEKRIEYNPSMLYIVTVIKNVFYKILTVIREFPRLLDVFNFKHINKQLSYAVEVMTNDKCTNFNSCIEIELIKIIQGLQTYAKLWLKYRDLWEVDRNVFLRKFSERDLTLKDYSEEIKKYINLSKEIDSIADKARVHWVLIDSTKLKEQLIKKCEIWHNEIKTNLAIKAAMKIEHVHKYCYLHSRRIYITPRTVKDIQQLKEYFVALNTENQKKDEVFAEIAEIMDFLDWYGFPFPSEMVSRAGMLQSVWEKFTKEAELGEQMVLRANEKYDDIVKEVVQKFHDEIKVMGNNIHKEGPVTSDWLYSDALQEIDRLRKLFIDALIKEKKVLKELNIDERNSIEHSFDFINAERTLKSLEKIWTIKNNWEEHYEEYMNVDMNNLNNEEVEKTIREMYDNLLKMNNWPMVQDILDEMDKVRKILPLVHLLKDPTLKPRHWEDIHSRIPVAFDEASEEFKVHSVFDLYTYFDVIEEIVDIARKESILENKIKEIKQIWGSTDFELEYSAALQLYKICSLGRIYEQIKNHQTVIQLMNSSRYLKPFIQEVQFWDRNLITMNEVVQALIKIQKSYISFEKFLTDGDLRKQLPFEFYVYEKLKTSWRSLTLRFYHWRNIFKIANLPELSVKLNVISNNVDHLYKAFDQYLNEIRHNFPRFCFLSNHGLFHTLCTSDPYDIQYNTVFWNIEKVDMIREGSNYLGSAMISEEQEIVKWVKPIIYQGILADWVNSVEDAMRMTLKEYLKAATLDLIQHLSERVIWAKNHCAQLCLTASKIIWTQECTEILQSNNPKQLLKVKWRNQVELIENYIAGVRLGLVEMERVKMVSLITTEIHSRDILERLLVFDCLHVNSYEWNSQMRFYGKNNIQDCIIRQNMTELPYGYEYIGNFERIIITPLTDRVFLSMTTALHLCRGSISTGPTATGKTETVKELAKITANYFVVYNSPEGLDNKSLARIIIGMAQTGAWICFEEASRVKCELLAVLTELIKTILNALSAKRKEFIIDGVISKLVPTLAIAFNNRPAAGERIVHLLPSTLRLLLRPVSVILPDSYIICENILIREGFIDAKLLAKKIFTVYKVSQHYDNKQLEYNFGLRGLVALLKDAIKIRTNQPELSEHEVILVTIKEKHMCLMDPHDYQFVDHIVGSLFPKLYPKIKVDEVLSQAIKEECNDRNYQCTDVVLEKVMHLYEMKCTRRAVIIMGASATAKTATWTLLKSAMLNLNEKQYGTFQEVEWYTMNPAVLTIGELYGEISSKTSDWVDGVFSLLMKKFYWDKTPGEKWIIIDGPIHPSWAESLNSLMDESKTMFVPNGGRLIVPEQVSLIFEVENVVYASPSMVSRCGIMHLSNTCLKWQQYIESWLKSQNDKVYQKYMDSCLAKYVSPVLKYKNDHCKEVVCISETVLVRSLCKMLTIFIPPEKRKDCEGDDDRFKKLVELWFIFSVIWTLGGSLGEVDRTKFSTFLKKIIIGFPCDKTVFDYYVDEKILHFKSISTLINLDSWTYNPSYNFSKNIPTLPETHFYQMLCSKLLFANNSVLLCGPRGTGKSFILNSLRSILSPEYFVTFKICLTSKFQPKQLEALIERRTTQISVGVFAPTRGRKLVAFLDDFNVTKKLKNRCQPTHELIRQWMDYKFWYDRETKSKHYFEEIVFLVASDRCSGYGNQINGRVLSHFSVIYIPYPSESQMENIFFRMVSENLKQFNESVRDVGEPLTKISMAFFKRISEIFLPKPSTLHYIFTFRDLLLLLHGLLLFDYTKNVGPCDYYLYWIHEAYRTFADRLVDDRDIELVLKEMEPYVEKYFWVPWDLLMYSQNLPLYCGFMNSNLLYEKVKFTDVRKYLDTKLEELNKMPNVLLNVILFNEAVISLCHISRLITLPRGHVIFVGVGGSGRKTLSRVASLLYLYKLFEISVSKEYNINEFLSDIKKMYEYTGINGTPATLILGDSELNEDAFWDVLCNFLGDGDIFDTNGDYLFTQEEYEKIIHVLKEDAENEGIDPGADYIYSYFIDRVRNNLRIVLSMNPIGEQFSARLKQNPALLKCCSVLWNMEWPKEALQEVAQYCLTSFALPANILEGIETSEVKIYSTIPDDVYNKLCVIFGKIHESLAELTLKMIAEKKQYIYISLERYLDFISQYKIELFKKRRDFLTKRNNLSKGLFKLKVIKTKHETLTIEYTNNIEEIAAIAKECELIIGDVQALTVEVNELIESIAEIVESLKEAEEIYNDKLDSAMADLKPVTPAYEAAIESLSALNKEDLEEVENIEIPPYNVEIVLKAVMVLLGLPPTWEEARMEISDIDFLEKLINIDKYNISNEVLSQLTEYTYDAFFEKPCTGPERVAVQTLSNWVLALQGFATAYKYVRPRVEKLDKELNNLHIQQEKLNYTQYEIENVEAMVASLKNKYQERIMEKNILLKKAEVLKRKLELGRDLIASLTDGHKAWTDTIEKLDVSLENLYGDCIFLAAYTIYLGPFISSFRHRFLTLWKTFLNESNVSFTENLDVSSLELTPAIIKEWNDNGLPVDKFSIDNAMIIKKSVGWPLIIDPHLQAWKWLETMESPFFLKIIEYDDQNILGSIESAMNLGIPVILRNLKELVDPALLPVLKKTVIVKGNSLKFKLGKRLVNYNRNFRFYMVTRIKNPNFPAEISMKTSIVNFSLNKHGLEPQLLNIVINIENPSLIAKKKKQTEQIITGKKRVDDYELTLLKYLDKCDESLFDKPKLLKKLMDSTSEVKMVNIELSLIEKGTFEMEKNLMDYMPCAHRATLILLVLDDLLNIDPMYKFSFNEFVEFLKDCIKKSPQSKDVAERMDLINKYFTYTVYKRACCMIFRKHQLILSFLICTKILSSQDLIKKDGINFLLKGYDADTLDISNEPVNPAKDWLPDELWYNLCALVKNVSEFPDILNSFSENITEWKIWYESEEPENLPFVDIVETLCADFHRVLIIRALRKDRLLHAIKHYVEINIGSEYVEPYVTNLKEIFDESTTRTPILFIKSSESVDPTSQIMQLADELNMHDRVYIKKIGEGQEQVAKRIIDEGLVYGFWIFIADFQNLVSWGPELCKIIESFKAKLDINKNFRLWLSSLSHPDFPITILRSSVKVVIEEPEGLKWHMKSIYSKMTDEQLNPFTKAQTYQKLLFALSFFHSQILERKKFVNVGCFGNYNFLISDFEDSQKILESVLKQCKDKVPWNILKHFIAETFYGGNVATWCEQRLINSYFDDLFNENVIQQIKYRMTSLSSYYIPAKGGPTFTEYLNMLPDVERPEVLGLDSNSSIFINSKNTVVFCETLLSLEMDVSTGERPKEEDIVVAQIKEILQKIPSSIIVKRTMTECISPLKIVLKKEVAVYNKMLSTIENQSTELIDGLNGGISLDDFLDNLFKRIYENQIPESWSIFYPTTKSLSSWVEDLTLRINYIKKCIHAQLPLSEPHWLSAYTCPTRILMAVLQEAAINLDVDFDQLTWEFFPQEDSSREVPSEGILVRGMFIEGARWDAKKLVLVDAHPLQYISPLSIMHFKPILKTEKILEEDMFECPVFYCSTQMTKDVCKEVYIFDIELNRGNESCRHWIKRGTAAFLCPSPLHI